jgi:general secretion pathway protein F
MGAYKYIVMTKDGKEQSGILQADSPRAARNILRNKGLIVMSIKLMSDKSPKIRFGKIISSLELILITRQFAILLGSGLSVEQSLTALIEQLDNQEQKSILMNIRSEVLGGKTLAASMAIYNKVFPPVYTSLVHAGEQSGSLAAVMAKLADYSDRTRDLKSKITMALLYPIMVTIVAITMIIALLVYVVPQVVKVFESSNQELPFLTKALIAVSNALQSYGIAMAVIITASVVIFLQMIKKNRNFKLKVHRKLLTLPIVGQLLVNIDVARFSNTMSLLLSSGVSIITALEAGSNTVGNYSIKNAILHALQSVQEGSTLAVALSKENVFPLVIIHMIASGEKSGKLDHLLGQAGAYQELELSHRSQLLTGILEPAMILFMGGVVLLIVIAIMLPILDMNNMIST